MLQRNGKHEKNMIAYVVYGPAKLISKVVDIDVLSMYT